MGHDDTGAIAAAMVTGKRDLLSADGRDIIRQAGIFHIITIAGVQMTLVAGLVFGTVRRLLALSPVLALRYPIKSWAAWAAILGAIAYDIGTGSRVGTQRALFMTLIMLTAVLAGRRALTMRNLAFAALAVIAIEPEQIAGASFQLSFAAVAALIAVQEARLRREPEDLFAPAAPRALAVTLRGAPKIWAIAGDTDGIDGTEDAAGAVVTPDTIERARTAGLAPLDALLAHDSYTLFDTIGDLVRTGPTLTNVNDLRAILIA